MRAGELRHRVTVQAPVETQGLDGSVTVTWQDVATVWAQVAALSGREYFAAQATQSEVTHRVRIRHFEGITAKHRLLWGSRVLELESGPMDQTGRREELVLMTVEVV